jgi:hexosaminidase
MKLTFAGLIFVSLAIAPVRAETVSPLQARGYTVMPQPQVVKLGVSDFEFGSGWKIEVQGASPNDVATETLKDELERRYGVKFGSSGTNVLRLILAPNSAAVGTAQDSDKEALAQQAYKIDLSRDRVTRSANPADLLG